ncbi:hypothetical protein L484_026087 [Morus notabilis]|uniref:Uncharacterized protein n=1 Tax=Morus notabilis TaxID=981085 RepID=W9R7Z4_9ROSA|nr:hypothetical protein L484_026087 [Morus notabilis]
MEGRSILDFVKTGLWKEDRRHVKRSSYAKLVSVDLIACEARFDYLSAAASYRLARCRVADSSFSVSKSQITDISINLARSLSKTTSFLEGLHDTSIWIQIVGEESNQSFRAPIDDTQVKCAKQAGAFACLLDEDVSRILVLVISLTSNSCHRVQYYLEI